MDKNSLTPLARQTAIVVWIAVKAAVVIWLLYRIAPPPIPFVYSNF